ncbi:hypothetical protein UPYG_G00036960 [Umbra pygmaea]|uniref:Uncharacterized protein n=1 Tax=Umbra pygmaea TaxID=75934 RepID=A0ABD0XRG6_UMBPY
MVHCGLVPPQEQDPPLSIYKSSVHSHNLESQGLSRPGKREFVELGERHLPESMSGGTTILTGLPTTLHSIPRHPYWDRGQSQLSTVSNVEVNIVLAI